MSGGGIRRWVVRLYALTPTILIKSRRSATTERFGSLKFSGSKSKCITLFRTPNPMYLTTFKARFWSPLLFMATA